MWRGSTGSAEQRNEPGCYKIGRAVGGAARTQGPSTTGLHCRAEEYGTNPSDRAHDYGSHGWPTPLHMAVFLQVVRAQLRKPTGAARPRRGNGRFPYTANLAAIAYFLAAMA